MKLYESKAPMEIMIFAFALKFIVLPHFFCIICQPNILSCCLDNDRLVFDLFIYKYNNA